MRLERPDLKFSFSTHKALSHVTDYDVHMAYDFFLGRPPENSAAIDSHKKLPFDGMIKQFIQSDEFMGCIYNNLLNKSKITRPDNTKLPSRRHISWITEIITFEEDEIKGFFLTKTWDEFFSKFFRLDRIDNSSLSDKCLDEKAPISIGLASHAIQSRCVSEPPANIGRFAIGDEWPTLAALFMENYYLRISGSNSRNRTDALRHFARIGLASGLSPGPLFDSNIYLDRAAEAGLPALQPGEPALLHWMRHGVPARIVPTTLFDEAFYRSVYSDVPPERFGFDHFIAAGLQEDRQPNRWFDPAWYRATTATIPPGYSAFAHFLEIGAEAGLLPHKVFLAGHLSATSLADWSTHGAALVALLETMTGRFGKWAVDLLLTLFYPGYYRLVVPAAAAMSPLEQLSHFLTHGIEQDIPPSPLFEPETYRRAWKDATGEEIKGTSSLLHWLQGGHEVIPVPTRMFSDTYYRARYIDMVDLSIHTFQHYLRSGIRENREPNGWFEPNWYMSSAGSYSQDAEPSYIQCLTRGGGATRASRVLWLLSGAPPFAPETSDAILDQIEGFGRLLAATESWLSELSAEQIKIAAFLFAPETYTGNQVLSPTAPPIEKLAHFLKHDLATGERVGPLFIAETYVKNLELRGESLQGSSPLLHFLKSGIEHRIVPTPVFNEQTYLEYNKDLREYDNWLFLHFIRDGLYEGRLYSSRSELNISLGFSMNSVQVARQQLISRMAANVTLDFIPPDLQAVVRAQRRFATLQSSDIFAKIMTEAQEIEPLVGERLEKREVLVAPFHDGMASQLRALLSKLQRTQYDHIICVPWVRAGGADLVSGFLSHAISELYPDQTILLLLTDNPHLERRDWIAAKVDILDMSEMTHQTAAADAERLLLTLVRGLHPRFVFNVNSRLCWQFMRRFGSRVGDTKLISYLFCWDQTATGVKVGYPSEFFQETQAFLTALLTDTQYLKDELNRTYALPEEVRHRIVPIASPSHSTASGPTMAERGAKSGSARERPLFLWGGRLDLQKRFDLLIKIARRMPDCDFHCWGSAMLDRSPNLADLPSNIQMMGDFKHLTDLPLGACEGWIFTSAWEGMPTTIIELGVLGMPLVASAVGGIPELIDATTGWIVSPFDDVERFVTCLREMIASPEARCVRANELRIRTQKRHNMRAYKAALARVLEGEAA